MAIVVWVKSAYMYMFKNQDLVVNSGFQNEVQKFVCKIENHSSHPVARQKLCLAMKWK